MENISIHIPIKSYETYTPVDDLLCNIGRKIYPPVVPPCQKINKFRLFQSKSNDLVVSKTFMYDVLIHIKASHGTMVLREYLLHGSKI